MKIGISTMIFGKEKRSLTLEEAEIISKTGFKYIELSDPHDLDFQVKKYLDHNRINIFSIHAEYMESDISSNNYHLRIKGIKDAKKRIDRIKVLGGDIIIIHPGGWDKNKNEKEIRLKNSIDSLVEITKYANLKKIKVAVENLPMEFLGDDPEVIKIILSNVRNKTGFKCEIGICLDTGHAFLTETLFEHLELFEHDIITMHLQDNIGDNLNDRSLAEDDIHRPPGHGAISWKKFFKKLNKIKYDGGLIFELKPDSIEGKNREFVLNEALNFMQSEGFFYQY